MRKIKLKPIKELKIPKGSRVICVPNEIAFHSIMSKLYERELFSDLWNKMMLALQPAVKD